MRQVWDQLPGPRVRIDISSADEVHPALDSALARLTATRHHRADARMRLAVPAVTGRDAGGRHGDMDMGPHGIPLASGAEDRDGLEMDEVHVPLGPYCRTGRAVSFCIAGCTATCEECRHRAS